jgi:hypothetical protein
MSTQQILKNMQRNILVLVHHPGMELNLQILKIIVITYCLQVTGCNGLSFHRNHLY